MLASTPTTDYIAAVNCGYHSKLAACAMVFLASANLYASTPRLIPDSVEGGPNLVKCSHCETSEAAADAAIEFMAASNNLPRPLYDVSVLQDLYVVSLVKQRYWRFETRYQTSPSGVMAVARPVDATKADAATIESIFEFVNSIRDDYEIDVRELDWGGRVPRSACVVVKSPELSRQLSAAVTARIMDRHADHLDGVDVRQAWFKALFDGSLRTNKDKPEALLHILFPKTRYPAGAVVYLRRTSEPPYFEAIAGFNSMERAFHVRCSNKDSPYWPQDR